MCEGIKFNFLSFSSRVGVGFLFYGFFSCFDGVIMLVLASTATETLGLAGVSLFAGCPNLVKISFDGIRIYIRIQGS